MTLFEGAPNETVTSCVMEAYSVWILYIGGMVDVFNTFLFLFMFMYPLCKSFKINQSAFDNNPAKKKKFITMMQFNVILSTICTISSFLYLFILPSVHGYLWFLGQIDMMINGTCVFFMMATNRRFVRKQCNENCDCLCYSWCCCNDTEKGKYQQVASKTSTTNVTTDNFKSKLQISSTQPSIGNPPTVTSMATPDTDIDETITLNTDTI